VILSFPNSLTHSTWRPILHKLQTDTQYVFGLSKLFDLEKFADLLCFWQISKSMDFKKFEILFPIVSTHSYTFEVHSLGLIYHIWQHAQVWTPCNHENSLVGAFMWVLSGSQINRLCRCPTEKVYEGRIWAWVCLQQESRCHSLSTSVFGNALCQQATF